MKFLSHDGLLYFYKKIKSYIDTKYNELFQSVSNGKSLVASAITGKGITTDATATFSTMASNINNIKTGVETGDATAVEGDVLRGKTFYKDNVKKTGTMVDIGSVPYKGSNGADSNAFNDTTMAVGTGYNEAVGAFDLTFKQGYINGSASRLHIPNLTPNKILAGVKVGWSNAYIEGTFTSDATATAEQILSGQTAYVNGNKVTGTIPIVNSDASDHKTTTSIEYGVFSPDDTSPFLYFAAHPHHYLNTSWYRAKAVDVANKVGLTANKLVAGQTVLGITGTANSGARYIKIDSVSGGYLNPNYSQSGKEIGANGWYTYPTSTQYNYRALDYNWSNLGVYDSWRPSIMKITQVKRNGGWDGYVLYKRTALITPQTKIVLWEHESSPSGYSKLMYVWTSETDSNPATVFRSNGIVLPLCEQAGDGDYRTTSVEMWG